ncbi:ATP-binding protein [Sinanaerobacter chloroacetimidivorans]|uniref:histidine kinase n=1 Tax=Sinanaerobacter chloroacetimidivorans TaxID=2818044 RepID=A0A8J8B2Z3_9FIRM|nr:ATP-binding protein [Sinanaerobacter chloroacetimidivorans]MBR0599829.1 GHKL domain-containing protein [Sinanaerobacter chloroacetimidivorans]
MKKISLRIMLAIIICSIATSTVLCVVSIKRASSVMNDEAEQMLSYASEKYSNQLSIYFKNTEGLVDSLAANVSVTFDPMEHQEEVPYFIEYKAYLDRIIKETLQYSDIAYGLYFTFNPELTFPTQEEVWYAFDEAGTPQAVMPDLSLNARDFTEPIAENMQYYFQPILEKKGTWTGPYVDSDVNLEMLSYSRAVYVDGVLVGVAGADILTDDTIDIVKTMKIYGGSSSFLYDDEKELIVSSNDLNKERYSESERQIQQYAEVKNSGVFHYFDLNEEYILAFSKLSNGWIIGITQPTKEVFSPTRGLILVLTLLTLICIVITIIFGIYFSHRLSKPIVNASDQLKLLKHGDYTHDIPTEFLNRKDDIGEFHNAILSIQSEMKKEAELNREKDILLIYQSKQAKIGEMVGNISHQWKQPLNSINLILLNLYEDYQLKELNDEEFKATIDKLMSIVRNMSDTIKDFTDFLKPNREVTEFDLNESIALALNLMEASLKYNHIAVEVNIDKGLKLLGYQNEFSHVLFNILNNARDAILESNVEKKLIQIRGWQADGHVLLEITNRGNPIPEETFENLFEPYFTTKNEKDGTGIGLYISKIIIEQRMHGHIELENVYMGVCCRICVKAKAEGNGNESALCGR